MVHAPPLNAAEHRFIEAVGQHTEMFGLPRIAGRTFGLLLIAPRPLALEEIAEILKVSRASVSINTRIGIATGFLRMWSVPGDRRKFYVFSEHAFEHWASLLDRHFAGIKRIVGEGLEGVAPENVAARTRLEAAQRIVTLVHSRLQELMAVVLEHVNQPRSE